MAFWEMVAVAMLGGLIHKAYKNGKEEREEQKRRINSWHGFIGDITEHEFDAMVKKAGRGIKRLKDISIDGPIVYGVVRTQSGLSEWHFKADFNDYGRLTGVYWLSSDNDDSSIPEHVAKIISSSIKNFSSESEFYDYDEEDDNMVYSKKNQRKKGFCSYCGKALMVPQAKFCCYCGKELR